MSKKGYKQTEEHIKKRVESMKEYKHTEETRRKMSKNHADVSGRKHPMYGKPNKWGHHTEETKKKMSETHKGKMVGEKNRLWKKHRSTETKRKISAAHKGKTLSEEHRRKISETKKGTLVGERHWNWKGGRTPFNIYIRNLIQSSTHWSQRVLAKDNYTCQMCGKHGGNLNAHHKWGLANVIKWFNITSIGEAKQCEYLWSTNNGITLCENCHRKLHNKIHRTNFFEGR